MALRVRTHVRTGQAAAAQGGGGGGLILDQLALTPVLAVSTRKLRTAYAGSAMNVFRSTDFANLAVGFDGSGNLDTAALATFLGATNGLVGTWYDQSGSGNDLTNGSVSTMPLITNAGVLYTVNSKAAVNFNGTNEVIVTASLSANPASGVPRHHNAVLDVDNLGQMRPWVAANNNGIELRFTTGGEVELLDQSRASLATSSGAGILPNAQHIVEIVYDPSGPYQMWVDGVSKASGSAPRTLLSGTVNIGAAPANPEYFSGKICETILFDVAVSAGNRATLEANQKTYWGTP